MNTKPRKPKHAPLVSSVSIEWTRADPAALAAFDPSTRRCTMNCGPSGLDPRSRAERLLLCDDCEIVPPAPKPTNRYGVKVDYFTRKLGELVRDLADYPPDELARALARLSRTADPAVMGEPEFTRSRDGNA